MRPRKTHNPRLPQRMYQVNRKRKNGQVWVSYIYRGTDGVDIQLGRNLTQPRLKRVELEAKAILADLKIMSDVFDRYMRDIIPKKSERTPSVCYARGGTTPGQKPWLRLSNKATRAWLRKSQGFSSVISDRRWHLKFSTWTTRAGFSDTQNRRPQRRFTFELAPSQTRRNRKVLVRQP